MAKTTKKEGEETAELSQVELEAKFQEESGDKTNKPKVKIKGKSNFSLNDYKKDKGVAEGGKMKPDSWIRMSPAFQEVTGLPGIIENSISIAHGKSDSGKSTMALELAKYAQQQNVLPVFIITEKKWSPQRCIDMGIDLDKCIINTDIDFIESGCDFIEELLKDQEEGRLPYDVVFIWDSIGSTPSKKEFDAAEDDSKSGGGMMLASRILRERISRRIFHKINRTKKDNYPYNATLFVVNQSYTTPPSFVGGQPSLSPYGGDGLTYSASLIFRMGGVLSSSSKVKATKDGVQLSFAIRTAITVQKNHVTNVSPDGKILCVPTGFITDSKEAIEEYKKEHKDGWNLEFDKDWSNVSKD